MGATVLRSPGFDFLVILIHEMRAKKSGVSTGSSCQVSEEIWATAFNIRNWLYD